MRCRMRKMAAEGTTSRSKRKTAQQSARRKTQRSLNTVEKRLSLIANEEYLEKSEEITGNSKDRDRDQNEHTCTYMSLADVVDNSEIQNIPEEFPEKECSVLPKNCKDTCTSDCSESDEDLMFSLDSTCTCSSNEEDVVNMCSADESDDGGKLQNGLAEWAVSCNVPLTTTTKLLRLLRENGLTHLPAQGVTLLKTPREVNIKRVSGGEYVYLGLKKGIAEALKFSCTSANELDWIKLSFNIDGLPLYKSKKSSLWPIQCSIVNVRSAKPFVISLYYSDQKPTNLDFLREFVDELREIMQNGIYICETKIQVSVLSFVCDAPARALVKGTIQFNGRYGCDFCDVRGHYDSGTMVFLYLGNLRSDFSFRQKSNPEHHKCDSPLLDLKLDIVNQFPVDPMHCVDLGVTKKLILWWKEGPLQTRLSANQISVLSRFHCAVRSFMPSDFTRKPRSLQDVKMWKATEFRTFLMYTGPVVLKYVLRTEIYKHFLSLSIPIRLLYNEQMVHKYWDYAGQLLSFFVEKAKQIYGQRFLSYNVHCLLHLAHFAGCFEGLENFTAYKFENNMSIIKRSVRGSKKPIVQVCRRLAEKEHSNFQMLSNCTEKPIRVGMCLKINTNAAKCKYCIIHEVQPTKRILCEVFKRTSSFYTSPCDSRVVGVHKVLKNDSDMLYINLSEVESTATCIYIPLSLFDNDEHNAAVIIQLVFYICEFQSGELSVVPGSWIFKQGGQIKCRWTSSLEKTKKAALPNPNWPIINIESIHGKRDTYELADSYLSDIKSDSQHSCDEIEIYTLDDPCENGNVVPKKRPRKTKNWSSDSSDEDELIRSSHPGAKRSKSSTSSETSGNALRLPDAPIYEPQNSEPCHDDVFDAATSVGPGRTLRLDQMGRLLEIVKEVLKTVNEIKSEVRILQNDVERIKAASLNNISAGESGDADCTFRLEVFEDVEQFELFCKKLENSDFRQVTIKYLVSNFGQRNIGEMVRTIIRSIMTDRLQSLYNRTGNKKRKLPDSLEKSIYACAKIIYQKKEEITVRRNGSEIQTTIKREVGKQLEIYLCNAATRIQRIRKQSSDEGTE